MHVSLETPIGARLFTSDGQEYATPVTLRHTSADPEVVRLAFPPHVTLDGRAAVWTVARALLADGLESPARHGNVRVLPHGRDHTVIEFASPDGLAALRFDTEVLRRFVARTRTVGASARASTPEAPVPGPRTEDVVVPLNSRTQQAHLLGLRLREMRQEQGVPLAHAAAAAGLSRLWAAQIESGEILDLDTVSRYASGLGARITLSVEYATERTGVQVARRRTSQCTG
ncbi:SsgA family sporulation/cell division regulator [Streptomyces xanthii]|uniref:SsgA family sporulation/cell division regulator n=1 Tax=Streptomyces xanthii TaxID=2768069 RepID=A0A7H1BGT6_9ACTN|nr:SsgA family sporulation/cell division regulator [Streptomyces xanthii]QNS07941.1 SsgA family sporulation/cell division regulator [Streptomyces xanthii]